MRKETYACGDIGGTNTRFALYEVTLEDGAEGSRDGLIFNKKYRNEDFASFADVLRSDGPREGQRGEVHQSRLVVHRRRPGRGRARHSRRATGQRLPRCRLRYPHPRRRQKMHCSAERHERCVRTDRMHRREGGPCEGRHADFAPRNELEMELLVYLKNKFGQKHRISVERIVSGTGLANVHEFLSWKFPEKIDQALHEQIEKAGDLKDAMIATNTHNELCRKDGWRSDGDLSDVDMTNEEDRTVVETMFKFITINQCHTFDTMQRVLWIKE